MVFFTVLRCFLVCPWPLVAITSRCLSILPMEISPRCPWPPIVIGHCCLFVNAYCCRLSSPAVVFCHSSWMSFFIVHGCLFVTAHGCLFVIANGCLLSLPMVFFCRCPWLPFVHGRLLGAGIACWLERRTRDFRRVAASTPGRNGGESFLLHS